MKNTINPAPDFVLVLYLLNPETGYYSLKYTSKIGFNKLPKELKIEPTARPDIIKAKNIIRSRQVKKKYPFFTGLRPTTHKGWFYGDNPENRCKKSFVLFKLSDDGNELRVYFFNCYHVYPARLKGFIQSFVQTQIND